MSKSKESEEHIKVFDWIRENEEKFPVLKTIFHTPNSFFGTNFGVINWLKKLGMRKGIYDIIIPISTSEFSSYWIEFKAEKKKLTNEQKELQILINQYSNLPTKFEVFYDSETCINSIKDYLTI